MRKPWVYKRKSIKGWWVGWYEGGRRKAKALPITCDNPKVVPCAFVDHGACVVHLVNKGAARTATVSGLPAAVKEMRVFVTDSRRGLQETGQVPVVQGTVQLPLDSMSFTSLAGNP
jgi:hypothetical protein